MLDPYELVVESARRLELQGWTAFQAMELSAYFWQRVQFGEGCWPWTGTPGSRGYGDASYKRNRFRSNRLALMVQVGPAPEGMNALHDCDNRICVRAGEGHLRWGTQAENLKDMHARGRSWQALDPERHREVAIKNLEKVNR